MIEQLTNNSGEKAMVSIFGFLVEPMAFVYISIGFVLGSLTTYLLSRYETR